MKKKIKSLIDSISRNTLWIGIASLLWLLFRSGSKPSRLRYPCQQAALFNASTFLPLTFAPLAHRLARGRRLPSLNIGRGISIVALCLVGFLLVEELGEWWTESRMAPLSETLSAHSALGVPLNKTSQSGRAVYATSPQAYNLPDPHRVVSVHDSRATNWDYDENTMHWEYIEQAIVDDMMARGLMALTEQETLADAWRDLIPYQAGEQVVIKMNFNNSGCNDDDQEIDGYPETVNAIADGLISIGVLPENIWVVDPSRAVPIRFRNRIENPNIQFYGKVDCDGSGEGNCHQTDFVDPNSAYASLAQCPAGEKILPAQVYVDAEHIINIPNFKSHGTYVTLALKNHYGSVLYENYSLGTMHPFFNQGGNREGCDLEHKNILADINNNPLFREKTRLVIGEGLFGNPHSNWQSVETWNIFGGDDPNIFFFSADPVAISSVMTDYIVAERGNQDHQQLHAAAELGLGVHEHWNSFEDKHYNTIDYRIIDLDVDAPPEVSLTGTPGNHTIHLTWDVIGSLPTTTTWTISYEGTPGEPSSPIPDIPEARRNYTITDLTNYELYTVTLTTAGLTPALSDTVQVMPISMNELYLPLIRR